MYKRQVYSSEKILRVHFTDEYKKTSESIAIIVAIDSLVSVSYTHLDVYKRQLQKGKNAIIRGNGRWRGIREADYKRTKAGDKDKGCLLYTSRCV